MYELATRLKEIWHEECGFSCEPDVLVIERPVIYPGSPVKPISLMDLTLMVGMLIQILKPKSILVPTPNEWKAHKDKECTKNEVINFCDAFTKRNIQRDLASIRLTLQHNVYDAVALGIYGIKVIRNELPPPRMHIIG